MASASKRAALLAVLLMVSLPAIGGVQWLGALASDEQGGDRGTVTVDRFVEARVPLEVGFEDAALNASYHLELPNSGTVKAASMTLEGVERYSLTGKPNDFCETANHMAYFGDNGDYPPTGGPSSYTLNGVQMGPEELADIGRRDGTTYSTSTPFGMNPPPFHYPYHVFDLRVNGTDMVRLRVDWYGWGFCDGNDTVTHGTEMWIWNATEEAWRFLASYAANDTTGQVRHLGRTIRDPGHFADDHGHVFVLVFGQHDERNAGGWPDIGSVDTDYVSVTVLRNDTLQWADGLEVSLGDQAPFWSVDGVFSGTVTLGDSEGLKAALQAYLDSVPPHPTPVRAPVWFRLREPTFAVVVVRAISITVEEANNRPPSFLGAREVEMQEDHDLARGLDLRDHFDDDLEGTDLAYAVSFEENASAAVAVMNPDGYHVDFKAVAKDWAGELRFRFTATDAWGLSTESGDFPLTVAEVNDPPSLVNPGSQYLDEDAPFELNLTFSDPDLPYGDTLTFSDDTELFDVDPSKGRIVLTPLQADVGEYNVTVTVRDSRGASNSVTFRISISDVNDPPSIVDPGTLVGHEGELFSYNFTALDEDRNEAFTWQLVGGVGTMYMGVQNGRLSWVPEASHVGTVNVSVIVRDRSGAAFQMGVTIEVLNVNDPPVLPALANAQLTEGERWVYQVVFSDPDLDVDPGEGHTFTVEPPLFAIAASGLVDFMPTNDHVGTHDLVVTVTDADGLNSSQVWRVVVRNVNQPPTIDRVEPQVWNEDEPVLLQIVGQDPDRGDVLTFSDTSSMFDIDPRTGLINFTPTQANVGSYSVQVRAQDRDGLYVTLTFDVTVVARNDPPVVSIRVETLKAHLREGDSVSLAADVEDEDTPRGEMGYKWTLDGKVRGVDDTLVLRNLRPGTHKVVLVVDDGTSKITAEHEFKVEAVEEPFPWGALVTAIVVLAVVATVALMFLLPRLRGREDDAEGGPGRDGEPGPKGP